MNNEKTLYNKNERNIIKIEYGNNCYTQLFVNGKEIPDLDGFFIEVKECMGLPKIELRILPSIVEKLK